MRKYEIVVIVDPEVDDRQVNALLEKPLDIPHLLTTVRRLLTESNEVRLRRLIGQEAPFDYRPSHGGPKGSLPRSDENKTELQKRHA